MTVSVRFSASRWTISRPARGMVLGVLLTLPIATPALAGDQKTTAGSTHLFAPFPVISQDEMARLRGGFDVAGLNLEFGANVRTLIDNVVRLETVVQFTPAGLVSSHPDLAQVTTSAPNTGGAQFANVTRQMAGLVKNLAKGAVKGTGATANQANHLSGLQDLANRIKGEALTSAGSAAASGNRAQQAGTAANPTVSRVGSGGTQIDLSGLGDSIRGVVLNDTKGLTAAIQGIAQNQITSTVINQANDRRIQVQLDLQVDIKNFSQYSEALRSSLLNQRLAQPSRAP